MYCNSSYGTVTGQGHYRNCSRTFYIRGSHKIFIQDLPTYEHPWRNFIQAPWRSCKIRYSSSRSFYDDLVSFSYGSWHEDLGQCFLQVLARRSCEDPSGMLSEAFAWRSSHKDLRKIMQGSPRGCHQELHNIFSQGSRQDLGQDFHVLCAMKPLQERHRRTFQRTQKISLPESKRIS